MPAPRRTEDRVSATVDSVARHAGVSRQTVSNAINAPEKLRPETLERVLASVDALGYRPHRVARSLRNRSTGLIGYRIEPAGEGTSNAVLDRFVHALTATAAEAGYYLLLFTCEAASAELETYEELIRTNVVDAFVLSGTHYHDSRQPWLAEHGTPSVAFGRRWGFNDSSVWVDVDGAAGTRLAVEHLVSNGHRRIAYIGSPADRAVGDDRFNGWRQGMRQHGIGTRELWLRGDDSLRVGAQLTEQMLQGQNAPSAIVCGSDTLAIGAVHRATELGIEVGRDLAVVGFDDSPSASFLQPGLSSVRQPLERVGEEIMRLLMTVLAGERLRSPHMILQPTLTIRASSARPFSEAATLPIPRRAKRLRTTASRTG